MLAEILGTFLSGLGLFFIGIKVLSDQMRQMAGRRFRALITRVMKNSFFAALWGLFFGAILQSTSGLTFIIVSLISSGLITVGKALPIITWANVGNSLLVLLAVVDIHLLVYYLLGIIGICFYFDLDRSARFRHVTGALFGIGLLFFGLDFLKAGAAPLNQFEGFRAFIRFSQNSYALVFLIGMLVAFIAHSSTIISVVAITMTTAGILGIPQTIMMIYGANLGSGLSTFFLSMNLRGTSRQPAILQTIFKAFGVLLLVPLFYIEMNTDLFLVKGLVENASPDPGRQMSYVYLIFQFVSAIAISVFSGPVLRLLAKISPPTEIEVYSKPKYLYDQALQEPETALDLIEKEIGGILNHFPDYLNSILPDSIDQKNLSLETLHEASQAILKETDSFITELMDQGVSRSSLERIVLTKNLTELMKTFEESLHEWVGIMSDHSSVAAFSGINHAMGEGLHVVLLHTVDSFESPDQMNLQMLLTITEDRGATMKGIRDEILQEEMRIPYKDRQSLYAITGIFERIFWLMHRIALLLIELFSQRQSVENK